MPEVARTYSWVVLTQGDRPAELMAALASIRAQTGAGVGAEIVVVSNGAGPLDTGSTDAIGPVTEVVLDENVGIPAGRNAGIDHASGDIIFFLDDDAVVAHTDLVERVDYLMATEPALGIISFRLVDPISGHTERRHVPRLRPGDPTVSGSVTHFLGGACAVRRQVFTQVGGYPAAFFYAMEESCLLYTSPSPRDATLYRMPSSA